MRRCERTGKRCFESDGAAKRATRGVRNKIRTYHCPHCHYVHVTSETNG